MSFFHIVILSLVQAASEFLPVSSSGHLVLLHALWGTPAEEVWGQSLIMDLAVHVGTLLAVLVYYRQTLWQMGCAVLISSVGAAHPAERRLAFFLIVASLPVLAAGLILELWEPVWLRSLSVVAFTLPFFGALLWWVDVRKPDTRVLTDMRWRDALLIGMAQVLALIPGTSRSGITMTAARWYGFSRVEAAKFSFLLSVIATSAAGAIGGLRLLQSGDMMLAGHAFVAMIVTFLAALGVIHWLLNFLGRHSFKVFGIYRIALGILLIAVLYADIVP